MAEFFFQDQETLIAELANQVVQALEKSINQAGRASLAVSGGSTPKPLFRELATRDLCWEKVVITLVDERWVSPSDPASNENLVRQHLLQDRAAVARCVGFKNNAPTAEQGQVQCEEELDKIPRPFTVLVLGMGNDGHTASLFPGSAQLAAATDMASDKNCMAVTPVDAPYERMTLTLPALLDSQHIILHITGQDKKAVLEQAQAEGPAADMPIRFMLRQQERRVNIYWAP